MWRPADRSKSNGVLFFNIINRGNKGGLALFNADIPGGPANTGNINAVTEAGDGFMQQQGYTVVWFGWQPDVVGGIYRVRKNGAKSPTDYPTFASIQRSRNAATFFISSLPRSVSGRSSSDFFQFGQSASPCRRK